MTTSYVKEKATGKILTSTGGQDQSNPIHIEAVRSFVTSRGWSLNDYELGFAEDDVVDGWIKAQHEADKTYADKRRPLYGTWEEQLDMMYHGTWKDHVAKVKQDIPKENK